MSLDTSATTSNASLSVNQAASLFSAPQEPEQEDTPEPVSETAPPETDDAPQVEAATETVDEAPAEADKVTIEVDGKTLELTKAELAEHYKNGLRQADYTKKTMETAEQRKAAEAETTKAREERQKYAQGLQQAQALLAAQLQDQSQIDWQKLLDTDPVEYLKQQHLAQSRQAQLQQIAHEQQHLSARQQAEHSQQMRAFIETQQQELLAKLPEWKDESKAKAEKAQIKDYLKAQGFEDQALDSISDHRAVLLARKAMMYDQMMVKAQAAAKKVSQLPQKVERPGGGGNNATDGRTAAMQRLQKSGSVNDAAAIFSAMRSK